MREQGLALLIAETDSLKMSAGLRAVLEERVLRENRNINALFRTFIAHSPESHQPPMTWIEACEWGRGHLGQMSRAHQLAAGQRLALSHVLKADSSSGTIVAVNGPPGTGKTTLVQSVVASLWVQRAVEHGAPPVVCATSTNNRAVTNILDSFAATVATDAAPTMSRWLPFATSNGIFHASRSADVGEYMHIKSGANSLTSVPTQQELLYITSRFMDCAQHWRDAPLLSVAHAMSALHVALCEKVDEIGGIVTMLSRFVRAFDLQSHGDRASVKARSAERSEAEHALRGAMPGIECEVNDLAVNAERLLDTVFRCRAFDLATHYWEARWLLETARCVDGKHAPREVEHVRLAMLAPCHVATCFTLPRAARTLLKDSDALFDLLIVDEAGQISPEVGAAAFALARNALVVGDTYQLEPIWNLPQALDRANIRRRRLPEDFVERRGLSASSGSIMRIAQQACSLRQCEPPHPAGLFLTEHRRCFDEIIAYCNELAYGGILEPMRGELPADARLPAMGLIAVRGQAERRGGGRRNSAEARELVGWIAAHLDHLCRRYGLADEREIAERLIGIVTPFKAQAQTIATELKAQGLPPFTVGTVHSLQGAERSVVLFSATYSADDRPARMFFDIGPNMLNVAVSRARDHFIVFGDDRVLSQDRGSLPSSLLRARLAVVPALSDGPS